MKYTHLFTFALAAALTAAPTFAQQETDKPADAPKSHQDTPSDKDKAAKPAQSDNVKPESTDKANKKDQKSEARDSKAGKPDQEPAAKNDASDKNKNDKADRGDASGTPRSDQEPATESRNNRGEAKGQTNERDKQAQYHFKGGEKSKLRSAYHDINNVNRSQRVTITRQEVLPVEVQTRIEPVPVEVVSYLPAPPPGFVFGFVDGYCVVYDPGTFFVIEVIDLV